MQARTPKRRFSIFSKVLLFIVAPTVIVLCAVQVFFYFEAKKILRDSVQERIEETGTRYSTTLSDFVVQKTEILKTLASGWSTALPSTTVMGEMLINITDSDVNLEDVFFAFADRQFVDGAQWVPGDDYDPTAKDWYKQAVNNKGVAISDV